MENIKKNTENKKIFIAAILGAIMIFLIGILSILGHADDKPKTFDLSYRDYTISVPKNYNKIKLPDDSSLYFNDNQGNGIRFIFSDNENKLTRKDLVENGVELAHDYLWSMPNHNIGLTNFEGCVTGVETAKTGDFSGLCVNYSSETARVRKIIILVNGTNICYILMHGMHNPDKIYEQLEIVRS